MTDGPAELLKRLLEDRAWTQKQLAKIVGKPTQLINQICKGKRAVTPETASLLAAAFENDPKDWLVAEINKQLFEVEVDTDQVVERAKLFELAPILQMQSRGWIQQSDDLDFLTGEVKKFFDVESLNEEIEIGGATRRTAESGEPLTNSQKAWCFRVRNLAASQLVAKYEDEKIDNCVAEVRKIAKRPQAAHKIPAVLNDFGIRFVVVEAIPTCKCDGVALWLNESSPVIGMSLQNDRVDSFFHTLMHELSHIKNRDDSSLDADIRGHAMMPLTVKPKIELRADNDAANWLVPASEMKSFISRVGPLYSKQKIIGFARRIKVHEGIVVGQLQFRGEIGYHANRELLVKIRKEVTSAALTDGYGNTI